MRRESLFETTQLFWVISLLRFNKYALDYGGETYAGAVKTEKGGGLVWRHLDYWFGYS